MIKILNVSQESFSSEMLSDSIIWMRNKDTLEIKIINLQKLTWPDFVERQRTPILTLLHLIVLFMFCYHEGIRVYTICSKNRELVNLSGVLIANGVFHKGKTVLST